MIEEQPEGVLLRRAEVDSPSRYEDVRGSLGPFPRVVSIDEMNQAVRDEAARRWIERTPGPWGRDAPAPAEARYDD